MLGGHSIQLARVFGVRIGVDRSWFVVLFLIIWLLSGAIAEAFPASASEVFAFGLAVVTALAFFVSVVLHELGHAIVARRNGIQIAGIDLWLFGGVARMRGDARSPGVDFRVAAAGPFATLLVVLASVGAGMAIVGPEGFRDALALSPQQATASAGTAVVLGYLAKINVLLLAFNLLPGLPLDGGRIARSIAWKLTGDRARATRIAALLGRGLAYLLIGLGIFLAVQGDLLAGVWLAFVGFFVAQAARTAVAQSAAVAGISALAVADVMDGEPVTAPADLPLDRAWDELFLRYGWAWFPVVDAAGRFAGVLVREDVESVAEHDRAARRAVDVVRAGSAEAFGVRLDEPLEALLGSEALGRLGAVMAVDAEGTLRGVLTLDHLKRALRPVS